MRHRSRKSEEVVWKREFIVSDDLFPGKPVFKTLTSAVIHQTGIHWKFEKEMFQKQLPKYSGLNLNQYGVASPCHTICTVCGFVALSWFLLIHYTTEPLQKSLFPSNRKPIFGFRLSEKEEFCKDRPLLQLNSNLSILTLYFAFHVFCRFHFKPTAQFTYCNQIFFFRLFKSN